METQLRARIESLVSILQHPIRSIEHKTFRRLLYRNRNQHRHGFYFRKLDHVRRILSQIDRHIAWESVRYTLGDTEDNRSQTKANRPLSISSLTVEDLKSVESLLDKLVNTVIFEATRRVVTDLVCREHFLPFAVSVLATLARLFVLERKVLSEVRGVGVEMKLLFATHDGSRSPKEHTKDNAPLPKEEDIGLEVSAAKELELKSQNDGQALQVVSAATNYTGDRKPAMDEGEVPRSESTHPSGSDASAAQEPSLYHLVAKDAGATKFSVEIRERISVSLPDVLSAHQSLEDTFNSNAGAAATNHVATKPDTTMPPASLQIAREQTCASGPDADIQQPGSSEGGNKQLVTKSTSDASDSDDIDDIFDALEDS